nr:zinc finger, CCHC-type [Tanacetum cinerariifolium]
MTNTQTSPPATTVVNLTGVSVNNTMANHAERPEKFNETVPQVEPPAEDPLYNVYCKTTTAKELWESLERKYKTEDAGTKKLVIARLLDYKMVDSKNVISQLPPSWVDFKNYLKHKQKEMSVEDLFVRLRIKEDNMLALKDTYTPDFAKANMIEHAGSSLRSNPKRKGEDKRKNDKKSKEKFEYLTPKAGIVKQKFQGTCYNCDQPGHRVANCKMPKRVNPRQANKVNDDVDMIAMVSDVCAMISEQNGIAERKNRTLKEMVTAMLISSGMSQDIWGEAILTATYLLNMIPHKEKEETPYELWMGRKPSYRYLCVWGCLAKETGSSSRVDDEVIQDKRQRDENDLQVERQDQVDEKMKSDGIIDKYKARLVIKGFRQRQGLDYFDTYSPVTRITSIRMILAIVALRNLEIHQMDVKREFLNGDLEEEIYMNRSEGFIAPGQEGKVCRLVKSLYGLKQAPKQWHQKFNHAMLESGFKINECDKCVYVKDTSSRYVISCLYVDDMLIVGSNDKMIKSTKDMLKSTKDMLKSKFDMKDMGLDDVILGIKIIRTQNELVLSQAHYVDKILNTHNARDSGLARTPIDTSLHLSKNRGVSVSQFEYSRIIGMLMYLMTSTRPDLAYAVSRLSRYTSNPSNAHWKAITRVLHYLRYSRDYGLHYDRHPAVIEGYSDANWISDINYSRSTRGAAISWKSSKQTVIAKSTMESEFIALDKCGEEAEWLRNRSSKSLKGTDLAKVGWNRSSSGTDLAIGLDLAGSESRPPMLNKENYVPWSSRFLRYAKSRPNGKLIRNFILNGPYVRRMIAEPGDAER